MVQTDGKVNAVLVRPTGYPESIEAEIDFDFMARVLGGPVQVVIGTSDLTILVRANAEGEPMNLPASKLTPGRMLHGTVLVLGPTASSGLTSGLTRKSAESVIRLASAGTLAS